MAKNPYTNPLILATPHMRGERVMTAQRLLAGHNAFSKSSSPVAPYHGRIDGEYGPATAGATKKAKYWLGYADKDCDGEFGPLLYNLLKGESLLSKTFAARRKRRVDAAKATNTVKKKALAFAHTQVGTKEDPFGSNRQKYGVWYGMNGVPWCAIFLSYCISHSGHAWRYSYVPAIVTDAYAGKNGLSITYHPEPGDIVAYTLHGSPDCHTAFFDSWVNEHHQDFYDLGGNTGPSNFSNGGEVLRQVRNISLVHHFIRLTL